jgi:DNA-binding response OmpR family regulator
LRAGGALRLPKGRVLVVDSDESARQSTAQVLADRDYEALTAASGTEGVARAGAEKPDLIILDTDMPGMDGFETCRLIKDDPKLKSIPVAMVTALTDKKDRMRGIEAGAEEFLSKPFNLAEMLAKIKILLKRK